jgi:hypothetical protein
MSKKKKKPYIRGTIQRKIKQNKKFEIFFSLVRKLRKRKYG